MARLGSMSERRDWGVLVSPSLPGRAPDVDDPLVQVDVIPGQGPEFTGSQAEGDQPGRQCLQPS